MNETECVTNLLGIPVREMAGHDIDCMRDSRFVQSSLDCASPTRCLSKETFAEEYLEISHSREDSIAADTVALRDPHVHVLARDLLLFLVGLSVRVQ